MTSQYKQGPYRQNDFNYTGSYNNNHNLSNEVKFNRPVDYSFPQNPEKNLEKIMNRVSSNLSLDEMERLRKNIRPSYTSTYDINGPDSKRYQDDFKFLDIYDNNDVQNHHYDQSNYDNGYDNDDFSKKLNLENSFGPNYNDNYQNPDFNESYRPKHYDDTNNYNESYEPNNERKDSDSVSTDYKRWGYIPSMENIKNSQNKPIEYSEYVDKSYDNKPVANANMARPESFDYDLMLSLADVNALSNNEAKNLYSKTNDNLKNLKDMKNNDHLLRQRVVDLTTKCDNYENLLEKMSGEKNNLSQQNTHLSEKIEELEKSLQKISKSLKDKSDAENNVKKNQDLQKKNYEDFLQKREKE